MENSYKQTTLNPLGIFASVILAILFVVTSFFLPVYYSVTGILKPKTITTVIQNIDYVEILTSSDEINGAIEGLQLDVELADDIIKSKAVGAFLEDCATELASILSDSNAQLSEFNAAFVQSLLNKHIDEILIVVEEKRGSPLEKEEALQEIHKAIENNANAIEQAVLDLEPVKKAIISYETITRTIQKTHKWYFALSLGLAEALFLGLIYLMRRKNFGGFIWIAVNTGIVGALVSSVAIICGSGHVKDALALLPNFASRIVESAIGTAVTKLTIALVVCFAIMLLSIVACVLLRLKERKKPWHTD